MLSETESCCEICGEDTPEAELEFGDGICEDCLDGDSAQAERWRVALHLADIDRRGLYVVGQLIGHLTGVSPKPEKFPGIPSGEWIHT